MRTIIHDLEEKDLNKFEFSSDDTIIDSNKCSNNCIGCFSCWIKHPKKCIYDDEYSNIVESIKNSDELVLISKCRYGCYSNSVKRVLERCIGYVLPYFTIRNGEIHHKSRYSKDLKLFVYIYGNIDELDKKAITDLVRANSVNLNASDFEIKYIEEEKKDAYIN